MREFDRPERVTSHQNFVGTGRPPKSGTRERPVNPAYYVVDIDHILGPAALFRCPVNPCIPPSGLDRVARHNPSAVSETKTGDGKGSPLYRLNMWYMRWGDTKQAMRMVRRFSKKGTC